ncbi:MAG: DUF3883 domain-containing protein [Verrucomicrobia bacterium]|nr:DUF3883 domain-containing protein [Verrucomicrobiota bacterium]
MDSVVDLTLEGTRSKLQQGTVLVDSQDFGTRPRLLFIIDHEIRDGTTDRHGVERIISRRLHHVFIEPDGTTRSGGPAPYLDFAPLSAEHLDRARETLSLWGNAAIDQLALQHAVGSLVPVHFQEVQERRHRTVDATRDAVHSRLTEQVTYWSNRYLQLKDEMDAGRQPRMQPENARRTAEELSYRLEKRLRELEAQRNVVSRMPAVIGAALIIPRGLLLQWSNQPPSPEDDLAALDRAAMENLGMQAVMEHERSLGFEPKDVSAENLGWDITSTDTRGNCRFIEVKARRADAATITVTKNEMLVGFNKRGSGWFLALVRVEGERVAAPHYIEAPFEREPGWAEDAVVLNISSLLAGKSSASRPNGGTG